MQLKQMTLYHEGGFFVEDAKDQELMHKYLQDLNEVLVNKIEIEGKKSNAIL